jgi:MFS family permease
MISSPPEISITNRKYITIALIFILIEATGIFEQVMMYTAVPTFMRVFSVNTETVSWAITIFLLVGTAMAPLSGRLGDAFGRRNLLIILLCISVVGSVISVTSGSFAAILVGRGLQGTSGALFPLLVGIAREVVPPRRVPILVSLTTGTALLGGALAGVVAGHLLDAGNWRLIFIASGSLGVLALLSAFALPRVIVVRVNHGRFDILGAVLLAPGVASLLYGVQTGSSDGLTPAVSAYLVAGIAVLAFWVFWELRISNPIFNLRMFRDRTLVLILVTTGLIGLGVFGALALIQPILMQSPSLLPVGLGLTPGTAGNYQLVVGIVGFLLSPLGGKIAGKYGAKTTLLIGIVLGVVGVGGFAVAVHNLPLAIAATFFTGLGTGFILVGLPNMIVEVVPPQNTGEAVGIVYEVGRTLFGAVGTALTGVILASSVVPKTTAPTLTAWHAIVGFIAITAILGFIVALFVRKVIPMDQRGDRVEPVGEAPEEAWEAPQPAPPTAGSPATA